MEGKKKFNPNKYTNDYKKLNYDRLNFLMPKGTKERIKTVADSLGITSSELVRNAINEYIEKNNKG